MTTSPELDRQRDTALAAEMKNPEQTLEVILDPKRRGSLYPFLHRLRTLSPRLRTSGCFSASRTSV
jgi:tRNA/tmRNA/rRNA uracil-C5-methylase (TrmA/RlmC/RlmD family)